MLNNAILAAVPQTLLGFGNRSTESTSQDGLHEHSIYTDYTMKFAPLDGRQSMSDRQRIGSSIIDRQKVEYNYDANSGKRNWHRSSIRDIEPPLVILNQVRNLLSSQRVFEARTLLQKGAASYPNDEQIKQLLQAVSPGRVSRIEGHASDRTREITWIRNNSHKYRNQWVAVRGESLVASASSLNELLNRIREGNDKQSPPIIQKIAPERGGAC